MNGLKNLIPKGVFSDNNFTNLKKKSEDLKKNINILFDHIQQINNIYVSYYGHFESNLSELDSSFPNHDQNTLKLFKEIISIFKGFNKELRNLVEKSSINKKSIVQLNQIFINDYNMLVFQFQEGSRDYVRQEQALIELCSNYYKMHKQMLNSIQLYKKSFMDVNIIYNKDEKIKRYSQCLSLYKNLEEDLQLINKKIESINKAKTFLAAKYELLERQLINFSSSALICFIDQLKNFAQLFFEMENNRYQIIKNKIIQVDVLNARLLRSSVNLRYQQYIENQVKLSECEFLPCFIYYNQDLKQDAVPLFKKMLIIYYQEITIKLQKKKILSKKLLQYLQKYIKGIDKHLIESYRDLLLNFQKLKKKIGQAYGSSWINFYNIVSNILGKSMSINEQLIKQAENKIKNIQNCINQEVILFDNFLRQFKNFLEKNISKKIIKKYTVGMEEKSEGLLQQQLATSREQITNISSILGKQISKTNHWIMKSENSLKLQLMTFLSDLKRSIEDFSHYSEQVMHNQYKEENYLKDYEFCQGQVALSIRKQMKFFEQIEFSQIKDGNKTVFDGEFNKIQGFKKIKKPKQLQNLSREENLSVSQQDSQQRTVSNNFSIQIVSKATRQNFFGRSDKQPSKHAQLLLSKIQILQNQRYIKSCSCSLSDRIVLSGRMYITTHRLFFYSSFNNKNLFFGKTFIQVPKSDIKKIQKKVHSVFINNAISITTTNGQLFFISFKSRGTIFDLLKNTFEVNTVDIFFEQQQESQQQHQQQLAFEDDMKEQTSIARESSIMRQIQSYQYVPIITAELQLVGLTPIKFLKLTQLDQEVTINHTTFPSFTYYFKDLNQHKDISIDPWTPNPIDYLNLVNIKENTPEIFTRKHSATVPLPPSNIPFMAKTSFAVESQSLFIVNQDKYIIESTVKSNGFPYCDAFDLRIKKTAQAGQPNIVKYSIELFVNFNQKVMVQSTIFNGSIQNSKIIYEKYVTQIKKYFKSLEKKFSKNNKKQTPQDRMLQQFQQLRQYETQIQALKDEKKQMKKVIQQNQRRIKYGNMGLLILAIIVFIQLYIIFA